MVVIIFKCPPGLSLGSGTARIQAELATLNLAELRHDWAGCMAQSMGYLLVACWASCQKQGEGWCLVLTPSLRCTWAFECQIILLLTVSVQLFKACLNVLC